jgi:allantoate deiminase
MAHPVSRESIRLLSRRLDELGRVSDEDGRLTRTFLSPAMDRASALVAGWMRESGLSVQQDETGNLIGRLDVAQVNARTLLFGSHLDTVRNAGRFDGALGVLLPIVALAELRRRGVQLPFAVGVLGFSEEEAVRFTGAYIGSKAYTGQLRAADLKLRDTGGNTLREVIEAHAGKKFVLPKPAHLSRNLIGYTEVHIEQGPVLESEDLAVGVVSAIASQTRGRMTFRGKAGHAGTTPMHLRNDALAGAAEFVLMVEEYARLRPPLVATVGTISVPTGATNVIPGETIVSLDVRHPSDTKCRKAVDTLIARAHRISRHRGLVCEWEQTMQHPATPCSKELTSVLRKSVRAVQLREIQLVSGAGHDAVVMAKLTPVAMLFVRCRAGLSHHPDEYASPADLGVALQVVVDFIERLASMNHA